MSEDFLSRWSRLKRTGGEARTTAPPAPAASPAAPALQPTPSAAVPAPVPLPPIESLEPGADIADFMKAEVEESLKRQALKKLLQDPRFNVMDGLDVYIDDYSQPDPLPAGWLEKMNQTARFGEYREPAPEEPREAAPEAREDPLAAPDESAPQVASPPDTAKEGFPSAESGESRGQT